MPEGGGTFINGRWYVEHALERMAPRTPQVMAELEVYSSYGPQTDASIPSDLFCAT